MLICKPQAEHVAKRSFVARKLMVQFVCPKCNRDLAWAYEYASVYCRVCDRWIRVGEIKRINPAKINPEQDQLLLF